MSLVRMLILISQIMQLTFVMFSLIFSYSLCACIIAVTKAQERMFRHICLLADKTDCEKPNETMRSLMLQTQTCQLMTESRNCSKADTPYEWWKTSVRKHSSTSTTHANAMHANIVCSGITGHAA